MGITLLICTNALQVQNCPPPICASDFFSEYDLLASKNMSRMDPFSRGRHFSLQTEEPSPLLFGSPETTFTTLKLRLIYSSTNAGSSPQPNTSVTIDSTLTTTTFMSVIPQNAAPLQAESQLSQVCMRQSKAWKTQRRKLRFSTWMPTTLPNETSLGECEYF